MAKLSVLKGATSVLVRIFIQDSASTTGAGKTGLTNTSFTGTKVYVSRDDDGNAGGTAVSLTAATKGTWSSGGIVEKDSTNMPGVYEFGLTNASLATGSRSAQYLFIGTGIVPCPVEIELTGVDNQDAVHGGMTALPNTACTTNASLLTSGTGTDQISNSAGKLLLQATQSGVTIPTVTTVTNQLTAAAIATGIWQDSTAGDFTTASSIGKSLYTTGNAPGAASGIALVGSNMGTVSSVTGAVGSVTAGVTVTTNNDKTGYTLIVTPPTAATIATTVWQDTTAGDFTTASSIGKSLYTSGNAPGAASGIALVGSNMGTATSVSGAVGSVTGAVGSVTGNVGGNVVGSVGSLTLTQTLSAARALDSIADTSVTLNDALQCAVASVAAQMDASGGTTLVIKTASTGTTLRTKTLTLISPPSTVPDKAV